ncbi:hypothetical protein KCP77_12850 [Salmonella enterica subsp. enterica]|nr:hypothetical protein KCP77_12850 [Salmonella enterica subsp. enterica]
MATFAGGMAMFARLSATVNQRRETAGIRGHYRPYATLEKKAAIDFWRQSRDGELCGGKQ